MKPIKCYFLINLLTFPFFNKSIHPWYKQLPENDQYKPKCIGENHRLSTPIMIQFTSTYFTQNCSKRYTDTLYASNPRVY